jgi:hypothetical protein
MFNKHMESISDAKKEYVDSCEAKLAQLKKRCALGVHGRCPQCRCSGLAVTFSHTVRVYVVSIDMQRYMNVPVYHCGVCSSRFNVHPVEVGFFPAQPHKGVILWEKRGASNFTPVWFEISMLDLFNRVHKNSPETTAQPWLKSLFDRADGFSNAAMSDTPPVHLDTINKRFQDALHYYGRVDFETKDFGILGVKGYAPGIFGDCAACSPAARSTEGLLGGGYADGNFKITMLEGTATASTVLPSTIKRVAHGHGITAGAGTTGGASLPHRGASSHYNTC